LKYGKSTDEIMKKGRSKEFQQADGVRESLVEQIPAKLLKTLDDLDIGQLVCDLWDRENSNRVDWLDRQRLLEKEYEEFIEPLYAAPAAWSSTLHYPVTLTVGKTYHARMLSAITAVDPPFNVKARKEANVEKAPVIQELMQYTTKEWSNFHQGMDDVYDTWVWDWCMRGTGILKPRWEKQFVKFKDVIEEEETEVIVQTAPDGLPAEIETTSMVEREVDRIITTFDGPVVDAVAPEDIVLVGSADPHRAEAVIHRTFMNRSDLLMQADRGVFSEERVEDLLEHTAPTIPGSDVTDANKHQRVIRSGESQLSPDHRKDRYELLEGHLKVSVDKTGIDVDVVVFVEKKSRKILRATYLHRIMQTGVRPFFKADFHLRRGATFGAGLPEIIYSLTKEIDTVRNLRMDFGLLSSLPFGYYRATSSLETDKIPIEPGQLVPLDNPQTDVFFPQLGNRTAFGFQEESAIYQMLERYTGTSDLQHGIIAGQGATRTATGARALMGESNTNLNVYLKRLQRPLGQLYRYMLAMLQKKIKPGFAYRLQGPDGKDVFREIQSREELQGAYDFILDANSANSNPQVQIEAASQVLQLTGNPLDIQLGIVSPLERFEAIKNYLQALGVKDYSRFIRKPQMSRAYSPAEMVDRIINGIDLTLAPDMDLQGFVTYAQEIFSRDDILGQFSPQQAMALGAKVQEATQLLEALQQQQAQVANQQQQQTNSTMGPPMPEGGAL